MKNFFFNKNIAFSIILVLIIGSIVDRVTPAHVEKVFSMVVSKNRTSITDILQPRDIEISKTVMIDRINIADKSGFRHPKLGDLGYSGDFFADINAPFTVKIAGDYTFFIGSDDGFVFSVDNKQICEWTHDKDQHDRPFATDACHVRLTTGEHNFSLSYFQGYGNAGLVMSYAYGNIDTQYLAGQNSKYIQFTH